MARGRFEPGRIVAATLGALLLLLGGLAPSIGHADPGSDGEVAPLLGPMAAPDELTPRVAAASRPAVTVFAPWFTSPTIQVRSDSGADTAAVGALADPAPLALRAQ